MNTTLAARYIAAFHAANAAQAEAQRAVDAQPFDFDNAIAPTIGRSDEAVAGGILDRVNGDLDAAIEEAAYMPAIIALLAALRDEE